MCAPSVRSGRGTNGSEVGTVPSDSERVATLSGVPDPIPPLVCKQKNKGVGRGDWGVANRSSGTVPTACQSASRAQTESVGRGLCYRVHCCECVTVVFSSVVSTDFKMEWTNEVIMEFLDLYEQEPTIWNPLNEDRKDRNKVYEAWKRIQTRFSIECSLKDLKHKKENLMATYRKLAIKVKKTSDAGREVYKPEWFAFEKIDSFLHTVYAPRGSKATEVEVKC